MAKLGQYFHIYNLNAKTRETFLERFLMLRPISCTNWDLGEGLYIALKFVTRFWPTIKTHEVA